MTSHDLPRIEARYKSAYEAWHEEVCRVHGLGAAVTHYDRPEGRGEPGTALRRAYKEREAAYAAWRTAQGLDEEPPPAEAQLG